jgi:hypothetical protein
MKSFPSNDAAKEQLITGRTDFFQVIIFSVLGAEK